MKILKFNLNKIYVFMIVLNVLIMILRFSAGDHEVFKGNIFSTLIFAIIFISLLYTLILGKFDEFILIWLSFYFAAPIIKLPFTEIGSLGLLNGIFLPLMLIIAFNPKLIFDGLKDRNRAKLKKIIDVKNIYLLIIGGIFLISLINLSSVGIRTLLSDFFELIAPLTFFYFVIRKCKNYKLIIWGSVFITLINIPLGIYQILFRPGWGGIGDWREYRIFGNLFWHNSYSVYLLPSILILYMSIRNKFNPYYLILMALLIVLNFFTLSRSGLLLLIFGVWIFEMVYKTGFKINAKKIILIFLLIVGGVGYYLISDQLDQHLQTDALRERTEIWKTIMPLIEDDLIFGKGIGSYELYRDQVLHSLSTHNYYLNIIFQLGFIGLGFVLYFVGILVFELLQRLKAKKLIIYSKLSPGITELGLSIIGAILALSFIGNAGFVQVISLNSWIILGCCVNYNEKK